MIARWRAAGIYAKRRPMPAPRPKLEILRRSAKIASQAEKKSAPRRWVGRTLHGAMRACRRVAGPSPPAWVVEAAVMVPPKAGVVSAAKIMDGLGEDARKPNLCG